jgi:hypothetical protein
MELGASFRANSNPPMFSVVSQMNPFHYRKNGGKLNGCDLRMDGEFLRKFGI